MPVAQGIREDLPGYDTPTFTLMPVGSTSQRPVQVSGFDDNGRLTPLCRLISASCSSGQPFAFGFLQIRSYPRHPCRSANSSPCRASRGLSPPSECALPGAPKEKPRVAYRQAGHSVRCQQGHQNHLAETEGFEPSMQVLPACSLSRGVPSTSRPRLRTCCTTRRG